MTLLTQRLPVLSVYSLALAATLLFAPPTETFAQDEKVEEVLEYADLLFSRDQFGIAAQQYQIFIKENPNSPNIQIAWFRLGECYLKVNQEEDAVDTFQYLVNEFKKGPFVGSAAYRLAVLRFNAKDYRNAVTFFKVAKDELTDETAKLQAQFYYGRSLQLTGQAKEALVEFEQVIAANPEGGNPFLERCMLETARLYFDLGETEKAVEQFVALAESATTQEFKEEATVRGGLLAAEIGDLELSEEMLKKAMKFSDTSPWKSLAQVGAIFNAFAREDYDRVIALYNTGAYTAPDESRAKMLLIVGHSFRIKGDLDSAVRLYALVEGKYPDRKEGIEAGYRKLQILHQQGGEGLPEAVEQFARNQRKVDPDSTFIDMAYLMLAEWNFAKAENAASGAGSDYAKKHYKDAAAAYKRVREANIDEKYHEVRLYKEGWSEIESGNLPAGILTLTKFLENHPESTLASSAIAKRAMAYQSQEDHQFALGDYQDLVKRFPSAPEVEFAMQQIALILAHQRKIPEMINAYNELLEKFPATDGAAEAHYWIGVGYFDLEQHQQAVPELEKARELDSEFEDKATLRLVICHYQLENIAKLAGETRRYFENEPEAPTDGSARKKRTEIPPQIVEYLGRKLAADGQYEDAEYFLSAIAVPDAPQKTSAIVWKLLGESRSHLKKHAAAIQAYDQYLVQTERPSERASAYLNRGIAQLCLRDFDAARNSAQESLRSQKEGRTNAEARILLGDIAAAQGELEEAAREYLVVSQIFMDPEVTPIALSKSINAYQSLGDKEKVKQFRTELREKFPNYQAPENLGRDC